MKCAESEQENGMINNVMERRSLSFQDYPQSGRAIADSMRLVSSVSIGRQGLYYNSADERYVVIPEALVLYVFEAPIHRSQS